METQSNMHRPLVPLADRPLAGAEVQDSERQTIWHNPTNKVVVLDIYVGASRPRKVNHSLPKGHPQGPLSWEEKNGMRRYTIKPGETRAIPSEFDMAIQHTQCHHVDCLQAPFVCKSTEEGHEKTIVGGLGPQLENRGSQDMPIAKGFITLEPALDDVEARRRQADAELKEKLFQEHLAKEAQLEAHAKKQQAEAELAAREKAQSESRGQGPNKNK